MSRESTKLKLSEDWWAVIVGFVLILLAAIGWLGPAGQIIKF
jgi:hypothetical protein